MFSAPPSAALNLNIDTSFNFSVSTGALTPAFCISGPNAALLGERHVSMTTGGNL